MQKYMFTVKLDSDVYTYLKTIQLENNIEKFSVVLNGVLRYVIPELHDNEKKIEHINKI